MKTTLGVSVEEKIVEKLNAYSAQKHIKRGRVIEQLIDENCEIVGLTKECPVCHLAYSEKCAECPQCKGMKKLAEEDAVIAKKEKRIKRLKEAITQVELYSQDDIESFKMELAELEDTSGAVFAAKTIVAAKEAVEKRK